MTHPLDSVHPTWLPALEPVEGELQSILDELDAEVRGGAHVLPRPEQVLRALSRPFPDARVLVVGQDPYPTPGHPVGLSFAVERGTRPLPRSLANVFKEVESDTGHAPRSHEDLEEWLDQGVVLLNRALSVRAGEANAHKALGWSTITDAVVRALDERGGPLVAILWGANAQTLKPLLPNTHVITSAHPSPLSASRGFFGSKPFTRTNEALVAAGADAIRW